MIVSKQNAKKIPNIFHTLICNQDRLEIERRGGLATQKILSLESFLALIDNSLFNFI